MCFACRGTSSDFVIKAEPTKEYVETIDQMMQIQKKVTNIDRSFAEDVKNARYPEGYIKVCASWVRRLWEGQSELLDKNFESLSKPTTIFDDCGSYDKYTGDTIPRGSLYGKWTTVLDFLEWYQVQLMSGFGIIIIDESTPDEYQGILDSQKYNIDCFNAASHLLGGLAAFTLVTLF